MITNLKPVSKDVINIQPDDTVNLSFVNLSIDGFQLRVPEGMTILEAAKKNNLYIPTLCYHPDLNINSNCRMCIVEVEGTRNPVTACSTKVREGMVVKTGTLKINRMRKTLLKLLLADHDFECTSCIKNGQCELQALAARFGITENEFIPVKSNIKIDKSTPSLIRDENKCIKCGRCVDVCQNVLKVGAIFPSSRSFNITYGTAYNLPLYDTECILCGQCSAVCPVGAIYEKSYIEDVWDALADPSKHVVVQVAPAVRVSLGDSFGFDSGEIVTGKLISALRKLGFDKVFDTNFAADLTIVEEGYELIQRLNEHKNLPMLTSCSPGWIKYLEHFYPDLIPHLSTCKSPQQMFGSLAKTYYAEKSRIPPENIFVVSVMPCTAKKFESQRPEMKSSGYTDVDAVLTTRELSKMLKEANIDLYRLDGGKFDEPFGISTGAGAIFGTTGGVMEAAIRSVYEILTGRVLTDLNFTNLRGFDNIKEAQIDLDGMVLRAAAVHGVGNAADILDDIRDNKINYDFIEVMACPGGCIGGGGQPYGTTNAVKSIRKNNIYQIDLDSEIHLSHKNPAIKVLYDEFLKEPLSPIAHKLLHTKYTPR